MLPKINFIEQIHTNIYSNTEITHEICDENCNEMWHSNLKIKMKSLNTFFLTGGGEKQQTYDDEKKIDGMK